MQTSSTLEQDDSAKSAAWSGVRAYLLATVCVSLAFVLRLVLDPLWGGRLPFVLSFVAVLVVAHFTEIGPVIFAAVAGFLLGDWFFLEPRHSLLISDPVNWLNALFYFAICSIVLFFTSRTRRALARERAARLALGRMAAIIESSDDAIIGKSLDGKVVSWNTGAAKLYGYTEAEAVGQPISLLMTPESGKELASLLERVGRGDRVMHFETTRRRKDGALVEVSLSISPIRNNAGQVVGASTIARDITERKRSEKERERLVDQQQKLLSEVKTLHGLLPICSYCKKIRDDDGSWNQLELYIRERSSASFTHSVCPECASRHFSAYADDPPPDK